MTSRWTSAAGSRSTRGSSGLTLMDVVLAIAVLAIAIPTLLTVIAQVTQRSVRSSTLLRSTRTGQELLEQILSVRFDERTAKDANGNWSTVPGPEPLTTGRDGAANEQAGNQATFDDVDDFNGFNETLAGALAGYRRSVTVAYVAPSNLNASLTIPGSVPNNWTPSYKRVVVTVTPPVGQAVTLITLVTSVNFL